MTSWAIMTKANIIWRKKSSNDNVKWLKIMTMPILKKSEKKETINCVNGWNETNEQMWLKKIMTQY